MSEVAICVPTYNQASYLAGSVRSAFNQTFEDKEVWLSDDCSTDDTPQVVAQLQEEFPSLRAFRQPKNLGMSGNPRWVVRQPTTEFILKLDSDDHLEPEYAAELIALLRAHPKAAYAHCAVNQINNDGHVTRIRRLGRHTGYQSPEESLQSLTSGFRVAANICLFRREALVAVDYYKEDMSFCDDWDLGVRLADAGWGNVYHEGVLASYRVWDVGNVRAKRALDEINGGTRVFEESLIPAFRKRNWSLEPIERARQQRALSFCGLLTSQVFSAEERQQLLQALRTLGDSKKLQRRLLMQRMGLEPLLHWRKKMEIQTKDAVKKLLYNKGSVS